jgi:hypothetical protein
LYKNEGGGGATGALVAVRTTATGARVDVAVFPGVGEGVGVSVFGGVGVSDGRGVKVGRTAVRVGVAVGLTSAIKLLASHASIARTVTAIPKRTATRLLFNVILLSNLDHPHYTRLKMDWQIICSVLR